MDSVTLDVSDLKRLVEELRELPAAMQTKVVRGAVATGASVIRNEAIRLAPIWTGTDEELQSLVGGKASKLSKNHPPPGTLKNSIYQTRLPDKCTYTIEAWLVGVRSGKGSTKGGKGKEVSADAYYARWVEYGHFTRAPKSAGLTRKARRDSMQAGNVAGGYFVLPRPFMRPAFETKKGAAITAMQNYIRENLPLATAAFKFIQSKKAA